MEGFCRVFVCVCRLDVHVSACLWFYTSLLRLDEKGQEAEQEEEENKPDGARIGSGHNGVGLWSNPK